MYVCVYVRTSLTRSTDAISRPLLRSRENLFFLFSLHWSFMSSSGRWKKYTIDRSFVSKPLYHNTAKDKKKIPHNSFRNFSPLRVSANEAFSQTYRWLFTLRVYFLSRLSFVYCICDQYSTRNIKNLSSNERK